MKRFYINVPYAEKDQAKVLGARWDPDVRRWYYTENQDALLFSNWFHESKPVEVLKSESGLRMTLKDFLTNNYSNKAKSLTYRSALAFGIPYPLESGWAKKYENRTALVSSLTVGKKEKLNQVKRPLKENKVCVTGPKEFVSLCSCDSPPWDDCEHTEYETHQAMLEMLSMK